MNTSIYYSIRHQTRFRYTSPVTESVMEVRMNPRSEVPQHCLEFRLQTDPPSQPMSYRDYHNNIVHHFNIPTRHVQLTIVAESVVQIIPTTPLPEQLGMEAWDELDSEMTRDHHWDMLMPGKFAQSSSLLLSFLDNLSLGRTLDPLRTLRSLNTAIYQNFDYVPHSTTVDSPIDDALHIRRGVCQDFAHIMIAAGRHLGIPCRYVSGYLYHRSEDHDRSEEDATHAWLEAYLPGLGWVGFDPTNNLVCGERHIRTAIGRDYADVPPTLGVFKGDADSELDVGVRVMPTDAPIPVHEELLPVIDWMPPMCSLPDIDQQQQQMGQQQQ